MAVHHVVLDTNVLIAGLRSRNGASFRLLSLLGAQPDIQVHLSVPLVLEYEAVAKREAGALGLTESDVEDVVDFLCKIGAHHDIFYLWRPVLRDPKDDMILELAVAASCQTVLTHNKRDFQGVDRFGLEVETPYEFLKRIGELK
jgi:putative PIN family toxin of toxin-antitoxin system